MNRSNVGRAQPVRAGDIRRGDSRSPHSEEAGASEPNRAYTFNSTNQYVNTPDLSSLVTTAASMFIRLKLNIASPTDGNKAGAWDFGGSAQDDLYPWTDGSIYSDAFLTARAPSITPSGSVARDDWHYVIIRSEPGAGNWKFYQNKIEVGSHTGDASISLPSNCLFGRSTFGTRFMNGNVDRIGLTSHAMTVQEITDLVDSNIDPPNMVWGCECNDQNATVAPDSVGSNDGTKFNGVGSVIV